MATSEKGRKVSGHPDRRRRTARRATDAAHQSRWLSGPVRFSIIAARADSVFSIKEELPQRVDVGAVAWAHSPRSLKRGGTIGVNGVTTRGITETGLLAPRYWRSWFAPLHATLLRAMSPPMSACDAVDGSSTGTRWKADVKCSRRAFPLLTQLRHRRSRIFAAQIEHRALICSSPFSVLMA